MLNENNTLLFDASGAAPLAFQRVDATNTTVLVLGLLGLILVAWIGRKDPKVWLAPLALSVFLGVVEIENYLDRNQRFDQISVLSNGVQVDSKADEAVSRFIAFNEIDRINNTRSWRFGQACRLKIALTSGEAIYSVNFFDHRGECASISTPGLARVSSPALPAS